MKAPIVKTLDQLERYRAELSAFDPATHSCRQLRDYISRIIYFIYSHHVDPDKYNSFARELEHDIAAIGNKTVPSKGSGDKACTELFISCKSEAELTLSSLIDSLLFMQGGVINA